MSRIGKQPIAIPDGVNVAIDPGRVTVNGPARRADAERPGPDPIEKEDGQLVVKRPTERGDDRALHGLTRSLVANMVEGVTNGFEKRLEIQGVGYRASLRGTALELNVGYSHPVVIDAPAGITFEVPVQTEISSRASTSSRSARSPPRFATCASPSRTRARASATRASTCAGRSGSGRNGDADRQTGAHPAPQARAQELSGTAERPRLVVFRSNRGSRPSSSTTSPARRSPPPARCT